VEKRGHKDWLIQQDWLAERRARRESAADLIEDCDATQVNQSALHLGTLYVFDALRDLPRRFPRRQARRRFRRLRSPPQRPLPRQPGNPPTSEYREACAKAQAAIKTLRDPKRKLSEDERRSLVRMVDDILGLPSQDDPSSVASAQEQPSVKDEPPAPESPPAAPPSHDTHPVTAR